MLEHHAHLLAVLVDVHLYRFALRIFYLLFCDIHPIEDDGAAGGLLQQVQAAEERGLAGTGGADDHHHVALVNVHRDAVQGLDGAPVVVFLQVLDLDQLISGRHGSFSFRSKR